MSIKSRLSLIVGLMISLGNTAHASLGGDIQSIPRDGVFSKAALRPQTGVGYSTYSSQTSAGTVIKQYAAANGKVFAVSWSGPVIPDLRQLLGEHFADYANQESSARRTHSHRSIVQNDLVVRSNGHMRAFSGLAYRPSLIPTGADINALR